jgi:hypothetical protein
LVELLKFEPSAGGDDEGAAGEEGFAGAREVAEEGDEAVLVGVGEGFEVVEDEEGAGAGEEAGALVGMKEPPERRSYEASAWTGVKAKRSCSAS